MTKDKKQKIIQRLSKKLANNNFYITDSQGLNVQQVNEIRKTCKDKNIHYQVIKNTLLAKTLTSLDNQIDYTPLKEQILKGPTSIYIAQKNASEPAKIIQKFQKTKKQSKPLLKGAIIDGQLFIGSQHLDALSKLKSKEVLIGELLSLLQAPTHRVIAALQSSKNNLAGVIKTLANR